MASTTPKLRLLTIHPEVHETIKLEERAEILAQADEVIQLARLEVAKTRQLLEEFKIKNRAK
jgi:hypothetical protein